MRTLRRLLAMPRLHRHTWRYHPRTVTGWGIVECTTCGRTDLYS